MWFLGVFDTRLRGKSQQTRTKREEKAPPCLRPRMQISKPSCSVLWMPCRAVVPLSSGSLELCQPLLGFLSF